MSGRRLFSSPFSRKKKSTDSDAQSTTSTLVDSPASSSYPPVAPSAAASPPPSAAAAMNAYRDVPLPLASQLADMTITSIGPITVTPAPRNPESAARITTVANTLATPPPPALPKHADASAEAEQLTREQLVETRFQAITDKIDKLNHGAMTVNAIKSTSSASVYVHLSGVSEDSFFTRGTTDASKPQHDAFKLIQVGEIMNKRNKYDSGPKFDSLDVEITDKYEGALPGTLTAKAYAAEMTLLAKKDNSIRFVFSSRLPPEGLTVIKLVERLTDLQANGLWPTYNERDLYNELHKYVGPDGSTWVDPNYKYQMHQQVSELVDVLNNRDRFVDFTDESSISLYFQVLGIADTIYQILLATELRLRLPRQDHYFTGMETRVLKSSLIVSKRWIDHVRLSIVEDNQVQWRSNIHEQQIDGLVRFADLMDWPYMESLRPQAETVYANMLGGEIISSHIWDWLFGVIVPGKYTSFKIMTALVLLTPETKHLESAPCYDSGLKLEDATYWRLTTVIGRVLGGSDQVSAAMHWIGPCPTIVFAEGSEPENDTKLQWLSVKARKVDNAELVDMDNFDVDDSNLMACFGTDYEAIQADPEFFFSEVGNMDNWVVPESIPALSDKDKNDVVFSSLKLQKAPVAMTVKDPTPKDFEYTASVQFIIQGSPVHFTLYTNVCFVCSHPCIGSHHVHKRQLPKLIKTVVLVKDLKKTKHWKSLLYINVQNAPDAEIAARAWCAERGYHALVKHENTCETCLRAEAKSLHIKVVLYR
ncbi:hypothetical protein BGZ83_000932 [Gryganskiella cystojenkinii]|nr:hypothetical protein BGZ83_000932 [Gryganskiella cystojenkinii]